MDQDSTWHGRRPWSSAHCVLDGDIAPLPKKGAEPPDFLARLYCGQTAGCIKMSLGVEVLGLGLRDIVFDVDPATLREKGTPALIQFLAHVYCGHGRPSQLLLSSL